MTSLFLDYKKHSRFQLERLPLKYDPPQFEANLLPLHPDLLKTILFERPSAEPNLPYYEFILLDILPSLIYSLQYKGALYPSSPLAGED